MGKVTPITEQFQHFVRDGKESLGGAERESSSGDEAVAGGGIAATTGPLLVPGGVGAAGTRAGLPPGVLRAGLRDAVGDTAAADRADAGAGVSAGGMRGFQRRAEEVTLLIREAFLQGISTRKVGRVVALVTQEPVSAQTVSTVAKSLDRLVQRFHEAPLRDEWA